MHASLLARRGWYQKNPYSLDYPRAEDREFFVRTWNIAKISVLAEPLYFYRWFGVVKLQHFFCWAMLANAEYFGAMDLSLLVGGERLFSLGRVI